MKKPIIGYCTITDPYNKKSWSGTHYFIMKALEKHCGKVIAVGPLYNRFIILGKIINKLSKIILKKNFTYIHSFFVAKEYARIIERKIKKCKYDVLFFPAGSQLLAYLNTNIPSIYLSDTTFKLMIDYYSCFSNLLNVSKKWGDRNRKESYEKSFKNYLFFSLGS